MGNIFSDVYQTIAGGASALLGGGNPVIKDVTGAWQQVVNFLVDVDKAMIAAIDKTYQTFLWAGCVLILIIAGGLIIFSVIVSIAIRWIFHNREKANEMLGPMAQVWLAPLSLV